MRSLKQKVKSVDSIGDFLPSFSLPASKIPEAKNWEVGKKYTMEIEVEMVGTSKDEYSEDNKISHRFKITKVGVDEVDDKEMSAKRGNIY